MLDDRGSAPVVLGSAAGGVGVGRHGRDGDDVVHPALLAAIEAAITAGACHEAQRFQPGLYSYVGEAHRRAAATHLRRFAEQHVHDGGEP